MLGRGTYDGFAPVWPHVEGEFADKFNSMPKYVISSTLENPEWNNTQVLRGDVVEEVRCPVEKAWVGSIRRPHMPIYNGDQVFELVATKGYDPA